MALDFFEKSNMICSKNNTGVTFELDNKLGLIYIACDLPGLMVIN
jgi:hypothetical protein